MVAFLREHIVIALIVAYTLGQITAVVVLGGLLPRDPGMSEEPATRLRSATRTPQRRRSGRRFSFAAPVRSAPRVSGSNRLRRFLDREGSTIEMN
jgi:hypothetical protein